MYGEIIVAGILMAVLYYEVTHISPGGMVTPAYVAIALLSPVRLIYTGCIVLISWVALKGLSRVWILYGRRKFALTVCITFLIDWMIQGSGYVPYGIRMAGYVIPALLVKDLEKQGFVKTGLSLGIVAGFLALFMLWFGVL